MDDLGNDLVEEFYTWESLGRGVKVWDRPVAPEPPFIPFLRGMSVGREGVGDDGKIQGLFGRVAEALAGTPAILPPIAPEEECVFDVLKQDEAPQSILEPRARLTEILLLPPQGEMISRASFQFFLERLDLVFPVTFELLAFEDQHTICLCVDSRDVDQALNLIGTCFPSLGIKVFRDPLLANVLTQYLDKEMVSRDLILEREFYFPIQSLGRSPIDPYTGIFAAMNAVTEGEAALVQINFSKCRAPWADEAVKLVTTPDGKPFFEAQPESVSAAKEKVSKTLYAVVVRISAIAEDEDQARSLGRPLATAFEAFAGQNGFTLAPPLEGDFEDRMVDVAARLFLRSGMLLNTDELLALVHFPDPSVHAPLLARFLPMAETDPPDELIGDEGLLLGTSLREAHEVPIVVSNDERLRHTHIIGASGSGKTTHLIHSILQDIRSGTGVAVLDPHGDLVQEVLQRIPEDRLQDVVLFDPADEDFPVGFNVLDAKSDAEKNLLESDLVSIFQRLSTSWGDQMTTVLANAIMAFLESGEGGTLWHLRRFLVDPKYRAEHLKTVPDPDVLLFWQDEYNLLKGSTAASIVGRLNTFMRSKLLRNMVVQKDNGLDFRKVMDEGKIFLAPLSVGLIGEENCKLLGSLLVSKFYQVALSRQDLEEKDRKAFFMYLDEAGHFASSSLSSILTGTRKYGLGLVLAHHYLNQFGSGNADVLNALLSSAHIRMCFKVEDQDSRRLAEAFDGFEARDLRSLGIGQCVSRVGPSHHSFRLATTGPDRYGEGCLERAHQARSHSREQYARPKAEVEKQYRAEVQERIKSKEPKKTLREKVEENFVPPPVKEAATKIENPPLKPAPPEKKVDESKSVDPPETVSEAPPPPKKELPPEILKTPTEPVSAKRVVGGGSKPEKLPGKGGAKHKAIQAEIKEFAHTLGLGALIEEKLSDGKGDIDVLVRGKGLSIAFEVALQSPVEQEIKNIQKSLPLHDQVVVVSDSEEHLQEIEKSAISEGVIVEAQMNVTFVHQEELRTFFGELQQNLPDQSGSFMGYTVKTNYAVSDQQQVEQRKEALHRLIAQARSEQEQQSTNVEFHE